VVEEVVQDIQDQDLKMVVEVELAAIELPVMDPLLFKEQH
jgi:hypothetical protein